MEGENINLKVWKFFLVRMTWEEYPYKEIKVLYYHHSFAGYNYKQQYLSWIRNFRRGLEGVNKWIKSRS